MPTLGVFSAFSASGQVATFFFFFFGPEVKKSIMVGDAR